MIEWNAMPKEPQEALEEETYLIFLKKSKRAITAMHDPVNKWFFCVSDEEERIYPYRYISFYAEMDWPDYDDGPMISFCEHDNLLVCEECAKRHQSTNETVAEGSLEEEFIKSFDVDGTIDKVYKKE